MAINMKLLIKLLLILVSAILVLFSVRKDGHGPTPLAITNSSETTDLAEHHPVSEYVAMASSRRGLGVSQRFLAQQATPVVPASKMTCNKYPRICRKSGSPGPDCCKKKCVNVKTDSMNCGKCGRKCKYNMTCCKGKCVNPMTDRKNCGACKKKCKKGERCVLGMCNYA